MNALSGITSVGLVTLALAACSTSGPAPANGAPGAPGNVAGGAAAVGGAAAAGTTGVATAPTATCADGESGKPAFRSLRRLSEAEYNDTLVDALGLDASSWQKIQLVGDIRQAGAYSTYSAALNVNQPWLSALVDSTFERSQALLSGPQAAALLIQPCSAAAIDAACATAVVKKYGYRLFRRPVTESEVADYVGLFTQGVSMLQLSPTDALAGMLAALMQSPSTLYIQQLGQPAASGFQLSGYELASILSYGLTGTAPSLQLLDSVASGALDTPAGITAATQMLLTSARGQAHMAEFFRQWLSYDGAPYAAKDPAVYNLPNTIATAMVTETQTFVDKTYQAGGSLKDLLTSSSTYVNASLASFYGWNSAGLTDGEFTLAARPEGHGIGLLAQGGLLARLGSPNSSSPTQRGLFVLRQLMCGDVPPPPADIPSIPVPSGNATTRERYESEHAVGSCGACHTHIDQIGFGLENFDGVGQYRTTEAGKPIDASGYIEDLSHATFSGPEDLARKLAEAPQVNRCLAAQMTAYVLGVSAHDGLCIAPAASYATGAAPLSLAAVLAQVVEPTHLQQRIAPQ
ncbi:MAG TPA: DUF1592 domain-containing protein [Polyangiaceae bacterium]|nr:DUF1592 domain-containing protein [Polyangiaceae bacterium]